MLICRCFNILCKQTLFVARAPSVAYPAPCFAPGPFVCFADISPHAWGITLPEGAFPEAILLLHKQTDKLQFVEQLISKGLTENKTSAFKICVGGNKGNRLRLHHLDKTEHFVRTFIGIALIVIEHLVVGCEILTPKLVDLKTAFVYVKLLAKYAKEHGFTNTKFYVDDGYGCLTIVDNVLKSVPRNTLCAFILPDKKLEKDSRGKKLLNHSSLLKIVKLPEKVFSEGVTTSVFVFQAGVPHGTKDIFACYIEDDGLETVKNQGRQDIRDRWQATQIKQIIRTLLQVSTLKKTSFE